MFISLTHDQVQFYYGSLRWQYNFNEIAELILLKKKKTYLLINGAFIAVTTVAYYCMLFTDLMDLYYVIPTLLCYTILIILRLHTRIEFEYYVIVKDIYQKEIKVKIDVLDRPLIGKQIDEYLNHEYYRILHQTQKKALK
ncbi:hypothetical protein D3C85_326440 [compost metagenome]